MGSALMHYDRRFYIICCIYLGRDSRLTSTNISSAIIEEKDVPSVSIGNRLRRRPSNLVSRRYRVYIILVYNLSVLPCQHYRLYSYSI